jgi:outer membrane protein insertion porin family
VWSASARLRYEQIRLEGVGSGAPVDVFDVIGDSTLVGVGFNIARSTVDSRITPSRGSRLVLGIERVSGDFNFTKVTAEGNIFFTLAEDFFGRKNILSFRTEVGYIFEDNQAPLFERFYAGGHSSFRGFRYRGVGPRGIVDPDAIPGSGDEFVGNDPVGGDFRLLVGTEYSFPIWREILRGVVFVDSGTVDEDLALDKWRASIGTGVRLNVPFLGDAPFAFDIAYPFLKQDGDETRFFSFSLALPF